MIFIVNDSDLYRLEAVLALAAAFPATITAGEIARRRGVPEKFLARLLSGLARSGVVTTTRGPNGGARLARPPEQVRVTEVLPAPEARRKGSPAAVWLAGQLQEAVRRTVAPLSLATLLRVERQGTETQYEI
jgi:Rrf2 family protein